MFRFENWLFPINAITGVTWDKEHTKCEIWVVGKVAPFVIVGEQATRLIGAWAEMFPDPERAQQMVDAAKKNGSPLRDIVIERQPLKPQVT